MPTFPRMSVTSMTEMLWSTKFHGKLGKPMNHWVESILSMPKKKYDQPKFCLMATQVVLLQKIIIIWDGRNHLAVTLFIQKRQPRYTALKDFLSVKVNQWRYIFVVWWNGDTYWGWLEACWWLFNGGYPACADSRWVLCTNVMLDPE